MGQDHWKSIPTLHRQRIFFDAVPSPSCKALGKYHAFAHCKVILAEQENKWAAVYVGSHNFSKKAWGLKTSQPGNVEFGVVLFSQDCHVLDEWRSLCEHRDTLGQGEYDMHVMLDDRHGNVTPVIDLLEEINGIVGVGSCHACGWLIKQKQFGFLDKAHRHFQPSFVTAGQ